MVMENPENRPKNDDEYSLVIVAKVELTPAESEPAPKSSASKANPTKYRQGWERVFKPSLN